MSRKGNVMLLSDVLKRENNNLDFVRLILASMVIYYHAPVFINPNGEIDLVMRLIGFDGSGYIAVQCFFVISGLLVFNSLLTKESVISYVISRFFRLVPGLAVVSIATVIICYFFANVSIHQYLDVALEYVRRTLSLNIQFEIAGVSFAIPEIPYPNQMFFEHGVNGSLWTIPYEVKMYAIVLAIWIISKSTHCKLIIPGLLTSLIMMYLFGIYVFNGGQRQAWFFPLVLVQ